MKRISSNVKWLALSTVIAVIDQAIKHWLWRYPEHISVVRLSGVFEIVLSRNSGAAFSVLTGKGMLLLVLTTLLLLGLLCILLLDTELTNGARCLIAIILGGGAGNWIDRFFSGAVSDYIRLLFIRFPVFNFADICITVATVWLMILLLSGKLETKTGETHGTGD